MARGPGGQTVRFQEIADALRETRAGQEASMYPRLFQLFVHFLGYPGRQVLADTAGDVGRPDLTCRAPNGLTDANGKPIDIDWIVVEAKDQRYGLSRPENREKLFAEKSKYITPNTAWFVMVDPIILVARPVTGGDFNADNDILVYFADGEEAFREKLAGLRAEIAGVPEKLKRFRDGDVSLIATEKLIEPKDATQRARNRVQVARRPDGQAVGGPAGPLDK